MMANMKPEDMKKMSEFAANMDPNQMDSMMKGMGGQCPPGMDTKQMCEQMKNMSPEDLKSQMGQAQQQMGAQKQYVYNGALHLKNEGNNCIKSQEYSKALESYDRAIENLRPHSGAEVVTLRLQLLSNAALCHLKGSNFRKAMDVCEVALKLDSNAVKPMFRRGLAHEGLGDIAEGLLDVKTASSLSPDDKAITTELERLRKIAKEKGIKEADIKPKAPPQTSSTATAGMPTALGPGSSSSSGAPGRNPQDMEKAMEELSKNPDMMNQAADMMKNMSPEDIAKMMPGADPAMVKSRLQDPDSFKGAMEKLNSMPEAERKKMLAQAGAMHGKTGPGGMPDMSAVLENPEMIQQMAEMAGAQEGMDPEQAAMMKQTAEQLKQNPEMAKAMSDMMKNMPPEQMENMMKMSASMKGGGKGAGGMPGMGAGGGMMGADGGMPGADEFLNNPDMMKAAEDMMKSMSPEMMASMAKSSGIDMDEGKAKMIGKLMPYVPYLFKCMRAFGAVKRGAKGIFSARGRVVIALVVLFGAVYQHYNSSG